MNIAAFRQIARLQDADAALMGDQLLNPDLSPALLDRPLVDAAVLIGVVERAGGASVILTQRNAALRTHSGQIAFPGGRVDLDDPGPEGAALRETEEEIGVSPSAVEVLGRLPPYISGTGYRVVPVLGVVDASVRYRPNPAEVDSVFEVPLDFLFDPANHRRESLVRDGRTRHFWVMTWQDRRIWGLTAGIIRGLYERQLR